MKTLKPSLNAFCLLALAVFALGIQSGWAALLIDDNFVYPTGNLAGNGGWTDSGASADEVLVASGNLTVTGLQAPTGNKVSYASAGDDAYITFSAQTTGTVYYSFALNLTSISGILTDNTASLLGLSDTGLATGNQAASVWMRTDPGNSSVYNLGIAKRTAEQYDTTQLSTNTTYFVVASYEFVSGVNNDVCKLWISPSSGSFGGTAPAATLTYSNVEGDRTTIGGFFFNQNGATTTPATQVDSLRIGNSWAEVTPIPEPATWALLALSLTCVTLFRHRRAA